MTRIVLFDLGNVIAAWDPTPRLAEYARRSGLSVLEVRERLATDDFWADTDRGVYSAAQMQERISSLLGCSFSRAELLELQAIAFEVRPEILRLAQEAAASARIGILTNNAPLLREAFPTHFPELTRSFAPILFSFEFGHIKPEIELFEAVTRRLAHAPSEIVFIDDQLSHVTAASSIGWDTIWFQSASQLQLALAERGLAGKCLP